MPESSSRSFSRSFWRTLQVALSALLVSAVLFIGLTRTEVGRNEIRQQMESAFNQRFEGSLSIGGLKGTLIDDLVATNVTLKDPSGGLVARVDSIVATPRWATLLSSTLSFRSLTLQNPHLQLLRDREGRWNTTRAFQRRSPNSSPSERSLDFSVATIRVIDGQVTTRRRGPPPSLVDSNWLFDYTQTEVQDITLEASVEWTEQDQLFDVEDGSMYLPGPELRVSTFRGQAVQEEGGWSLTRFDLTTTHSRVRAAGSIQQRSSTAHSPTLDLRISRSRVDYDELRRILPRLPLTDVVTVKGHVRGTFDRLRLSDVAMTHGDSFLRLKGILSDLPSSLEADLTLTESHFSPSDLQEVWPNFPLSRFKALGSLDVAGHVGGTAHWKNRSSPAIDFSGTVQAQSPEGALQGSFSVDRTDSEPIRYTADLRLDSLNLAPLPETPALSTRLNGHLQVEGQGITAQTLNSTLDLSLSASRVGPQQVASAQASLWVANQTIQGSLTLRQLLGGRVEARGSISAIDRAPSYQVTAETQNLDVAPPEGRISATQLNAHLTVEGEGRRWESLSGTAQLRVDSSSVRRADQTVALPPHSVSLRLAEVTSAQPRIQLGGSVGTLSLDGTTLGPPLWSTSRVWLSALQKAVHRELEKPAPSPLPTDSTTGLPSSFSLPFTQDSTALHEAAQAALARSDHQAPLRVSGSLEISQSEVLHAWWPHFPKKTADLTAETEVLLDLDSLHVSGHLSASQIQFGSRRLQGIEAQYEVNTPLRPPLADVLSASFEVAAQSAQMGLSPLLNPEASFSYAAREGRLQMQAESMGVANALRLRSSLRVAPDRNKLTIREASMTVGSHEWTLPAPGSVLLHPEGIHVASLRLESAHHQLPTPQRLSLEGTLSSSATDTLSLRAQHVLLNPFAQVTETPRPIGGQLSGRIDVSRGWRTPELAGRLTVQRLSYDRRVLGDLHVQSRYTPDTPDLVLDASLNTKAPNPDSLSGPALVPGGPRSVEPNRLQMSGRVRLPQWISSLPAHSSALPPGENLDLTIDIERADLFFFEYVFEEKVASVQGFTTGTVHVGGNFRRPLFNADLDVENGAVSLPQFGLRYRVNGPVGVDRQGIHLQKISVTDDEGSATVDGSILFNEYRYFSFDLRAQLDGITVIDVPEAQNLPFYGHIRGSGPATLTGPLSDASLRSESVQTTADSELYIPASEQGVQNSSGFIIFADSTGQLPNLQDLMRRDNILSDRPAGEPTFVDGLEIDLNVFAPEGSTVNLVFDPLVGDVVTAVGSGRVQLQRQEGEFYVYGTFNATSGTYLFTAGEVFVRRFSLNEGTITWDGNPTNAQLNLNAEYRTRASPRGLPNQNQFSGRIPVTIELGINGRVASPQVDLSLSLDREERAELVGAQTLDAILNQPDRTTEYATSVLLTNTFLLTTDTFLQTSGSERGGPRENLTAAGYNSVSQLVASQLNRYLGAALPNVDLNFGLQGENPNDLDVIYGIALRLLNERLVIRGEGVYTTDTPDERQPRGPQGEFVVEVRLSPRVSAEVFYRRTSDNLTFNRILTSSAGAGLSYQTEFSTWYDLFTRVFGWMLPDSPPEESTDPDTEPVTRRPEATDSTNDESTDSSEK